MGAFGARGARVKGNEDGRCARAGPRALPMDDVDVQRALLACDGHRGALTRAKAEGARADGRDLNTPDHWVARHPSLVRLTGTHPFNCEPPLRALMEAGSVTPAELHFVRNHGAAQRHRVGRARGAGGGERLGHGGGRTGWTRCCASRR